MSTARRYLSVLATLGLLALILPLSVIPAYAETSATVPNGFRDELVWSGLSAPSAVVFAPNGRVFVSLKDGRINVFDSLTDGSATTLIDLSSDVHNYWDRGLLGLAVDPSFPSRPYVYALYTYDHVLGSSVSAPRWGTGSFSDGCPNPPQGNTDGCMVSGRLERLTVSSSGTGNSVSARKTLIEDWCQQYPSHSIGALGFGPEGALYVSGGDGASFNEADWGQLGGSLPNTPTPVNPCSDPNKEGGGLRSQDLRTTGDPTSLDGTVLRVNPDTGAAWPTNANAGSADANRARIIAYGLRNPFRFVIRPNGHVWVGDVGWGVWEEINKITDPSAAPKNFGWPCYEGDGANGQYMSASVGLSLCTSLTSQSAPTYRYNHSANIVSGDGCTPGSSSISGLAFLPSSSNYPSSYDDGLFFTDYSRKCIWFAPNSGGNPDFGNISRFANLRRTGEASGGSVFLGITPAGDLIYTDYDRGEVRAIRYYPPNAPPTASFTATPTFGALPLTVQFDASGSSDSNGHSLTYAWDLDGDGQYDNSTAQKPSRTYTQKADVVVRLRVTDNGSPPANATTSKTINPGSFPPVVTWPTPAQTLTWKVGDAIAFSATATDEDGAVAASGFSWTLVVDHCPSNCHQHTIQSIDDARSGSFTAPDHEYPSHLTIVLAVTDNDAMTTTLERDLQPITGTVTAKASPIGITISLGAGTGTPPAGVTGIVGSSFQVSAPETAAVGSLMYVFDHWSDAGARNHSVTVAPGATKLTATYRLTTVLPFSDIGTSRFVADIVWLRESGITSGCSATTFCPDREVTRGQMASFLARALALPAAPRDYYTDDRRSPHQNNINKIAAAGITHGCSATKFCPDDVVTRAQMASFLARALALASTTADFFTDDESSPHERNINRVAAAEITRGCGGTRYCPDDVVTRGQMAAFLHRALED